MKSRKPFECKDGDEDPQTRLRARATFVLTFIFWDLFFPFKSIFRLRITYLFYRLLLCLMSHRHSRCCMCPSGLTTVPWWSQSKPDVARGAVEDRHSDTLLLHGLSSHRAALVGTPGLEPQRPCPAEGWPEVTSQQGRVSLRLPSASSGDWLLSVSQWTPSSRWRFLLCSRFSY